MRHIKRNWITSFLGSASLATAVTYYFHGGDLKTTAGMIVVGLLGIFAADGNKTKPNT